MSRKLVKASDVGRNKITQKVFVGTVIGGITITLWINPSNIWFTFILRIQKLKDKALWQICTIDQKINVHTIYLSKEQSLTFQQE